QRANILARLSVAPTLSALAKVHLIVEAIIEQRDAKQVLFTQLESIVANTTVFASNTSSLSITALAQGLTYPQRVIGWHFFNPATRMKLVEIILGVKTDPTLLHTIEALSCAWGKIPVHAPNTPGFIVNRVARPYYAESLRLLAENIAPLAMIDKVTRDIGGFAMGPFELMDLIGTDINLAVTESVFNATAYDRRYAPHTIQQELVRAQYHGRKCGIGFYDYRQHGIPTVSPHLDYPTSNQTQLENSTLVTPTLLPTTPPIQQVNTGQFKTSRSQDSSEHTACVAEPLTEASLTIATDTVLLSALIKRLKQAGITIRLDSTSLPETLRLGNTTFALTDGRTAEHRASILGVPCILIDLANDFSLTQHLAAAPSVHAESAFIQFSALLARANIELIRLQDIAGLIVMRLVACLANEAAELLSWGRTLAIDIDTAMRYGTAYPQGPLAWADALGHARIAQCLAHLQAHYGDTRYRCAPTLSHRVYTKENFHD
ncbi:MAG: 3-hydroxyacyl-CoA dehydrogenase, partial [Ottowia sp.]|nr:3-hydroxyacyl-CoA dehydrogenase [Ottowia sp.]